MSDDRAPLDAAALAARLHPRWTLEVVAQTRSTNADLLARPDVADGTVRVAEHQLAGRGRFDRSWTSPARAGLTVSIALRPAPAPATWGWLPLLTGLALVAAARTVGVDARLKWPNDLLAGADERKAGGILVQTAGPVAVVGVGVNVSTTATELPVTTATSLALAGAAGAGGGPRVDRAPVLVALLAELADRLDRWTATGGDATASGLAAQYRATCATLGRVVRVDLGAGASVTGEAIDIAADGTLVVATASGPLRVSAGDVVHVRPA